MNDATQTGAQPVRRRIRYIDAPLQRWLWLVLILEIIAAAACVAFLYWRLNGLIEASLYRIHLGAEPSIVPLLLNEGVMLLLLFVGVNIAALFVATYVWTRYVGSIVAEFSTLVEKTRRLDFSSDETSRVRHEVLSKALQWRSTERERLDAINAEVATIVSATSSASAKAEALSHLQRLLP